MSKPLVCTLLGDVDTVAVHFVDRLQWHPGLRKLSTTERKQELLTVSERIRPSTLKWARNLGAGSFTDPWLCALVKALYLYHQTRPNLTFYEFVERGTSQWDYQEIAEYRSAVVAKVTQDKAWYETVTGRRIEFSKSRPVPLYATYGHIRDTA